MLIFHSLFLFVSPKLIKARQKKSESLIRKKIEKLSESKFPDVKNAFYDSIIKTYLEFEKLFISEKLNILENKLFNLSFIITIILVIYISIIIVTDFHYITIQLFSLSNFIQNNLLTSEFFNKQNLFSIHHIPWKFYEIQAISFILSLLIPSYSIKKLLRLTWKHFYIPTNQALLTSYLLIMNLGLLFCMYFTMSFLSSFKVIFFLYPLLFYLVDQIFFLIIFPFFLHIYVAILEFILFICICNYTLILQYILNFYFIY